MLASIVLAVALTGHCAGEDVAQLSELLSIPSVSDDAGECDRAIEWMKSYLESRGVWCKVLYAPEANGRKVLYVEELTVVFPNFCKKSNILLAMSIASLYFKGGVINSYISFPPEPS